MKASTLLTANLLWLTLQCVVVLGRPIVRNIRSTHGTSFVVDGRWGRMHSGFRWYKWPCNVCLKGYVVFWVADSMFISIYLTFCRSCCLGTTNNRIRSIAPETCHRNGSACCGRFLFRLLWTMSHDGVSVFMCAFDLGDEAFISDFFVNSVCLGLSPPPTAPFSKR